MKQNEYPIYGHSDEVRNLPQYSGDLALRRDGARDYLECTRYPLDFGCGFYKVHYFK